MAEHSPNTSEYSMPHESAAEPETHVDSIHFGDNGEHQPQYDVHHITDPGAVQMGQQTYEWHQSQKDEGEDGNSGK